MTVRSIAAPSDGPSIAPHVRGRTLHFIDTTGPGGAETIYLQIAAGMRERGWESRAVVVGSGWVLDRLRDLELPFSLVETNRRFDLRYIWQLQSIVRRHRIQLIHAHLFSPSLYASLIGAALGIPVVATFHGASDVATEGLTHRWRHGLIGRHATTVCVSESIATVLNNGLPGTHKRLRVVYNGVDIREASANDRSAVRREYGISEDVFLVGSLGNVRPAKDYPTLLRAAAAVTTNRPVRFAIVGEPSEPLSSELAQLRAQLGLENRVSFWGFRDDIPEVLAAFDALVISSSSEGFSLAAVQAMAARKPVVATRCGGPEEIVTDSVDGLLVSPSSPGELATAIGTLIESPSMGAQLGANAHRTVIGRFSLAKMLDSYEEIYRECIGVEDAFALDTLRKPSKDVA